MIGIFAAFSIEGSHVELIQENNEFLNNNDISNNFYCHQEVLNKFSEDKIWFVDSDYCVMTDGVIVGYESNNSASGLFSSETLLSNYKCNNLHNYIKSLRGSFSGVIVDKTKGIIIAFTDHICSKPLFVYSNDKVKIVSSNVTWIVEYLNNKHILYNLDEIGAYCLLTYGYMYGNYTLVEGIKKIQDGCVATIDVSVKYEYYHVLNNKILDTDEDVAVATINHLFCDGLQRQVKRNRKNCYIDAIPLSAGMDGRMTSYAFNAISKRNALNFTYSETGEYDFVTPPKMAHELKNRWLFKSLDNGLDLMNIEESIKLSDGLIYYAWPAQLVDFIKLINTKSWGIVHTGVLGDVVIGTYIKNQSQRNRCYEIGDGAYSTMLLDKLKKRLKIEECDYEIGMIRNRGFNGACMGYAMTFKYYAEDMSPFLNIDLLDYCLSLPTKLRERHFLYYKWVQKCYPEALEFKHNGITPKGKKTIKLCGKVYRLRAIPDLIRSTINSHVNNHYGMNPIQSWYDNNLELRECMDSYFLFR